MKTRPADGNVSGRLKRMVTPYTRSISDSVCITMGLMLRRGDDLINYHQIWNHIIFNIVLPTRPNRVAYFNRLIDNSRKRGQQNFKKIHLLNFLGTQFKVYIDSFLIY